MPRAMSARPSRWAAAVPRTTGATAAGRVRGRAPATHWDREAMEGSDVLEEVGVVVGAARAAALLLAAVVLPALLLRRCLVGVAGRPAGDEPGHRPDDR